MMGDTKKRSRITASTITFNPHPHVEGDILILLRFLSLCNFNPHPRVEGDFLCRMAELLRFYFNPHPRVEGDIRV